MTAETAAAPPPLTAFIRTDAEGAHYLAGSRCEACGHTYVGDRSVCAACCARGKMKPVHLANTGKVWTWTIVERSFPGVKSPFIDVIVDLDDGAHIKGTLEGVEPTPDAVKFDLPVKVSFHEVQPVNTPGKTFLGYSFVPA